MSIRKLSAAAFAAGSVGADALDPNALASQGLHTAVKAVAVTLPSHSGTGTSTLTASANGALIIDGTSMSANNRVLYAPSGGGVDALIYTVTNAGSAGAAWVLTRASDSDSVTELPVGCTVYDKTKQKQWRLAVPAATLGSDPLTWEEVEEGLTIGTIEETGDGATDTYAMVAGAIVLSVTVASVPQRISDVGSIVGSDFVFSSPPTSGDTIEIVYGYRA